MEEKEWSNFTVEIYSSETVDVVWSRLWDLDRHSRVVPFTTVLTRRPSLRIGARFIARTTLGPVTIDDRMVVRRWEPPHQATIEKVGPFFFGAIDATITCDGDGCLLRWKQHYRVNRVPDRMVQTTKPLVEWAYRRTLKKILSAPTNFTMDFIT